MSGPIAPNIFEPPSDPTTSLAARAPAPILIISFLLALKAVLNVVNAADGPSGPIAWLTAVPALAALKNARPAPVSIKFMENDLRLRDLLAFRLTAMFGVTPESGAAIETPDLLMVGFVI